MENKIRAAVLKQCTKGVKNTSAVHFCLFLINLQNI